jgi:hypothetical protein
MKKKPIRFTKYQTSKATQPPAKFSPNFLAKMDRRFALARELETAYQELISDQGGIENLSHAKKALCEKFVWLECILRKTESQIASSDEDSEQITVLLSRWIQAVNSLQGLCRQLGIERKAKRVSSLETYVKARGRE